MNDIVPVDPGPSFTHLIHISLHLKFSRALPNTCSLLSFLKHKNMFHTPV